MRSLLWRGILSLHLQHCESTVTSLFLTEVRQTKVTDTHLCPLTEQVRQESVTFQYLTISIKSREQGVVSIKLREDRFTSQNCLFKYAIQMLTVAQMNTANTLFCFSRYLPSQRFPIQLERALARSMYENTLPEAQLLTCCIPFLIHPRGPTPVFIPPAVTAHTRNPGLWLYNETALIQRILPSYLGSSNEV